MATLTKGMSYRRQGSSGLIWADNMMVTEDGIFAMNRPQQPDGGFSRNNPAMVSDSSPAMARSKSVGSAASVSIVPPARAHKSSFRVLKWLKKAFMKIRG